MRAAIAVAALTAALAGCTTIQRWTPRLWEPTNIEQVHEAEATRVMLQDDCPVVSNPSRRATEPRALGSVIAAVAPAISDFAFDQLRDWLTSSADELSTSYRATGAGEPFGEDGKLKSHCVVVVRGVFGGRRRAAIGNDRRGSLTEKNLNDLGLADFPTFYFEAWLEPIESPSTTQRFVMLRPQVLHFVRSHAEEAGAGIKTIDVILSMSHSTHSPKVGIESNAIVCVPLEFLDRKEGSEYRAATDGLAGSEFNPLADQNRILTFSMENGSAPRHINLYANVIETEGRSVLDDLMTKMLQKGEQPLEKALTDFIKGLSKDDESHKP